MANGFVDLQAELSATEDEGADFFRALSGAVERGGFFGDERRVSDQIERIHEFIALKGMLAAKTIGIRTLLNFFALRSGCGNTAPGNHFALATTTANAGRN